MTPLEKDMERALVGAVKRRGGIAALESAIGQRKDGGREA